MIKITFYQTKDGAFLKGFLVNGHSGSEESGRDVICAFVSSAALLTANTVTDVIHAEAKAEERDGYMKLLVADFKKESVQHTLRGFELHIKELYKMYPQYLKIIRIITEV